MIFTFSIREFGHPQFFKSQFGHPVMKILAKSLTMVQNSPLVWPAAQLWSTKNPRDQRRKRSAESEKQEDDITVPCSLWVSEFPVFLRPHISDSRSTARVRVPGSERRPPHG